MNSGWITGYWRRLASVFSVATVGGALLGSSSVWAADDEKFPFGPQAVKQAKEAKEAAAKQAVKQAHTLPEPATFKTADGMEAWKIRFPGGSILSTPAVVGNAIYVGGGLASNEFYSLDAVTGKQNWGYVADDSGPTAASVGEGSVGYNTKSCTLYIHDELTGVLRWKKWLASTVISQPAIGHGMVYVTYPESKTMCRVSAFRLKDGLLAWHAILPSEAMTAPVIAGDSVYVATANGTISRYVAESGRLIWKRDCDATSAPIIAGDEVIISQRHSRIFDSEKESDSGVESALAASEGINIVNARTGDVEHAVPLASAPARYLVHPDDWLKIRAQPNKPSKDLEIKIKEMAAQAQAILDAHYANDDSPIVQELRTQWAELGPPAPPADPAARVAVRKKAKVKPANREEMGARFLAANDKFVLLYSQVSVSAVGKYDEMSEFVDEASRVSASIRELEAPTKGSAENQQVVEAAVKEARSLAGRSAMTGFAQARGNIGANDFQSIWTYEGSRPLLAGNRCINIQGSLLRAIEHRTGRRLWETPLESSTMVARSTSSPVLAGNKIFLGTAEGSIVCCDVQTGKILWQTNLNSGPIMTQPVVVSGNVYAATSRGVLVCLKTGDATADGWPMWGGSPSHNGPVPTRPNVAMR